MRLVLRRVYEQLAVYNTIKWPVESGFGRSSDERLRWPVESCFDVTARHPDHSLPLRPSGVNTLYRYHICISLCSRFHKYQTILFYVVLNGSVSYLILFYSNTRARVVDLVSSVLYW